MMNRINRQTVLSVHHWTDTLFSFTCTRDPDFQFDNGQFTLVGLEAEGKLLMRAYSMVSANDEETLEFFSIKVPGGRLTSHLQHIQPGDTVFVGKKPVGTLVIDHLLPGATLWLLSTGTGLAPFLSIIKDARIYGRYQRIVLTHTCRLVAELAYREYMTQTLPQHERLGQWVREKLIYYPSVTRESFIHQGRITDLIEKGTLFKDLDIAPFTPEQDRLMLCGSPQMVKDMRALLQARGFQESSAAQSGHYVVEKAFVD
jgi:ferredoxin/flavodoxin---NADP+ reductase